MTIEQRLERLATRLQPPLPSAVLALIDAADEALAVSEDFEDDDTCEEDFRRFPRYGSVKGAPLLGFTRYQGVGDDR